MVERFRYLEATLTYQSSVHEEVKSRFKSGNACYHSVQNPLSYSLLSKNVKIKIYWTVILPFVLYGCATWSVSLREEHGLREFENRVLRRIFGPMRDEVTGKWRKLHSKELYDLYSWPLNIRVIKSRKLWWAGHVARMWERRGAYSVLVGRPEGKNHLEDLDIDGRIILKCMFRSGMGWHALVRSDSGQGQVAGACESRNGFWVS